MAGYLAETSRGGIKASSEAEASTSLRSLCILSFSIRHRIADKRRNDDDDDDDDDDNDDVSSCLTSE